MDTKNDTAIAPTSLTQTHDATNEPASRAAAARVAPEMAALAHHEVEQVSVDIAAAVARVMSVWEAMQVHLPAIAALPNVDGERVTKLYDYALNLIYWQGSATYAPPSVEALSALAEQGYALRERTLVDLAPLAAHGVIEASALSNFRGTNSHKKLGQDLIGLSNLVHDRWDVIANRSLITLEAMDEAMRLGEAILKGVGDREQGPAVAGQAVLQRDKAFTLFSHAYDEARRAILFLRWHEGDGDSILPSMYTRPSAKKKSESAPVVTPPKPTPKTAAPATSSLIVPFSESEEASLAAVASPFVEG